MKWIRRRECTHVATLCRLENVEGEIFRNKWLLKPETIVDEERIVGRDDELDEIIEKLKNFLNGEPIPDLVVYGDSGTGKSLIINLVSEKVVNIAESRGDSFGVITLNGSNVDTYSRAVYRLANNLRNTIVERDLHDGEASELPSVPHTGVPTDVYLERFFNMADSHFDALMVIIDEIDKLVDPTATKHEDQPYSRLLYQFSRAENMAGINTQLPVAALTNDGDFAQKIGSRADSSFRPDPVVFSNYDANQLKAILEERKDAFHEGVLEDEVIPLSAAFGARNHGDARRAIDHLRITGKIAEEEEDDMVREEHTREANREAHADELLELMTGYNTLKQTAVYAIAAVEKFAPGTPDHVPSKVGHQVFQFCSEHGGAGETRSRDSFLRYLREAETGGIIDLETVRGGQGKGNYRAISTTREADLVEETLRTECELGLPPSEEVKPVVVAQFREFNESSTSRKEKNLKDY